MLRNSAAGRKLATDILAVAVVTFLGMATHAKAQSPRVHYQHAGVMQPGAIGSQRLERGGPVLGYFQPVEIRGPEGTHVAMADAEGFTAAMPMPHTVGVLIGSVYRLRVTHIPLHEGFEIFPTIEVIDRLYPPAGQKRRFAIPIVLTREELEMAMDGKFVTRVIYVEDPRLALPIAIDAGRQPFFDAPFGESPLDTADAVGRPVAILRIGSRLPEASGPDATFLFGAPPVASYVQRASWQSGSRTATPAILTRR